MSANEAKSICEIWELTELELGETYKDALEADVRQYFVKKTDIPPGLKAKTAVKPIREGQFKKLVDIYPGDDLDESTLEQCHGTI